MSDFFFTISNPNLFEKYIDWLNLPVYKNPLGKFLVNIDNKTTTDGKGGFVQALGMSNTEYVREKFPFLKDVKSVDGKAPEKKPSLLNDYEYIFKDAPACVQNSVNNGVPEKKAENIKVFYKLKFGSNGYRDFCSKLEKIFRVPVDFATDGSYHCHNCIDNCTSPYGLQMTKGIGIDRFVYKRGNSYHITARLYNEDNYKHTIELNSSSLLTEAEFDRAFLNSSQIAPPFKLCSKFRGYVQTHILSKVSKTKDNSKKISLMSANNVLIYATTNEFAKPIRAFCDKYNILYTVAGELSDIDIHKYDIIISNCDSRCAYNEFKDFPQERIWFVYESVPNIITKPTEELLYKAMSIPFDAKTPFVEKVFEGKKKRVFKTSRYCFDFEKRVYSIDGANVNFSEKIENVLAKNFAKNAKYKGLCLTDRVLLEEKDLLWIFQ